jgi:hypothetical protein
VGGGGWRVAKGRGGRTEGREETKPEEGLAKESGRKRGAQRVTMREGARKDGGREASPILTDT